MSKRCECCFKPATMTCGFGGQPELHFCDSHYIWHMTEAHKHTPIERAEPGRGGPSYEYLRSKINGRGVSMRVLAKRLGVSVSTLSRFAAGKGGLSVECYRILSERL